ncbi:DUF6544 family protein [Candidatus Viridilinea mediisalina]|uniref:Uncharacterized protein n=1 Tax=Candidatus Viridilinea mediisalina TaxID=2024553 RepID=A0A2A6RKX5_9CHLR|nr:DUF6544 family protein [Candidatus Viridilinea mediisalina]PDW03490.1 hypothetical protein CJ255_08385 [Candidatus Viridilinea mediisalina]
MINSIAKTGFILITIIHGLIHLLGFVKAFNFAQINELTQPISRPFGLLWLLAALVLIVSAAAFALNNQWWWAVAIVGVLLSQVLVFSAWQDAKVGAIANLIIIVVALLSLGSFRFEQGYRQDANNAQERVRGLPAEIISEAELQALPQPLQRYLRYVGVVGKPKVHSMFVEMSGEMRQQGRDYFPLTAEQHTFFDQPTRLFFMKGQMFGLTVPGYHRYQEQSATMDVRLFGLLPVMQVGGSAMFEADTVTLFNDMALMAPATLIDQRITWETIDDLTVKGNFTNQGVTISATLHFNAEGQLVNFVSNDRWDVAAMQQYPFSTPVSRYRTLNGYNLPTYGEMIWHYPDGDFVYGRLEIKDVVYNNGG